MGAFVHRTLAASTRTDGGWEPRRAGERNATGWVVSPILSNLFLHYTFDIWMQRNHPTIPFERYADDVICHCRSEEQARTLRASLETRFAECGLTLHPDKTKLVYCKDDDRRGDYPDHKFDFLGYTFRPRLSRRTKCCVTGIDRDSLSGTDSREERCRWTGKTTHGLIASLLAAVLWTSD